MDIKRQNIIDVKDPLKGGFMGWDFKLTQDEALFLMEQLNTALHMGHARTFMLNGPLHMEAVQIEIVEERIGQLAWDPAEAMG